MFAVSKAAQAVSSAVLADAIDFDGTNDYLSRSSDLVGNADGKTFTFSCWVWSENITPSGDIYWSNNTSFAVYRQGDGTIGIAAKNSAGTTIFGAVIPAIRQFTFFNILVSVDLSNTSNRYVFVNDSAQSVTWNVYTNDNIDFTRPDHKVCDGSAYGKFKSRLSHVYLDYTYRDLSVEANRRLFITADRKPAANQSALNPILYLPLNDPTQPGKNLGTGGDFSLTGVVARSGRGPSQFNAPYSDLDGAADYLSRTTAITGIADGKQVTLSFCLLRKQGGSASEVIQLVSATSNLRFRVYAGNNLYLYGFNSSGTNIVAMSVSSDTYLRVGRNAHIVVSFDLANTSNRYCFINGRQISEPWGPYSNQNIQFTPATPTWALSRYMPDGSFAAGCLGNVFFDTKYIDLSVPANLAKFVTGTGIDAKPADLGANGELPFGTPPLIYLPMYGNNAGKNYGTGGDFTAVSGPFPGARGPNEFWGNLAKFGAGNNYLTNSSLPISSKTISFSYWMQLDSNTITTWSAYKAGSATIFMRDTGGGTLELKGYNSAGALILACSFSHSRQNSWLHMCIDLSDTNKRFAYENNTQLTVTWSLYTDATLYGEAFTVGHQAYVGEYYKGKLSEFYFTTDYIDFSQEANRLKFRDCFGNPVDLAPQIAAGTLPNPAIYLRFAPDNFGKNSGTGGDFTKSGTILDGGQL